MANLLLAPSPEKEAFALDAWESLAHQIALAEQESTEKVFDYEDPHEAKQARSWIARLRAIRGGIERARKNAKAVHLERGRAIDNAAKVLEATVANLIEPHQLELDAIKAREEARIAAHRSVLDFINSLSQNVQSSADATARLVQLEDIDTSGLEEFAVAARNRKAEAIEELSEIHNKLKQQEDERAELEALRRDKEEREKEEQAECLRQEGAERERLRQSEAARQQKELPVSAPVVTATRSESALASPTASAHSSLVAALKGKTASQVATEIINGTFHPSVVFTLNKS